MLSLVKHFRTGLVAFSLPFFGAIRFPDADVYIYDSQGPYLPGFYKERNRRDNPGCLVAVEDGV